MIECEGLGVYFFVLLGELGCVYGVGKLFYVVLFDV